jgi:hypothetical protein
MKYRLINYFDVWGNAREGWEVNNLCEDAIVYFPDYPSKEEIIKKLKSIGWLKKSVRMASIIDTGLGDGDFIDFEDRRGMPIFRLERNEDTENETCYHKEYSGINIRRVSDEAI